MHGAAQGGQVPGHEEIGLGSDAMYIPVILGTARDGRFSESVAKFMLEGARKAGLESDRRLSTPQGRRDKKLTDKVII